ASRLLSIGLEYRYVTLYLQGKLTKQEMMAQLRAAIHQYAKRQMTWWKRNDQIHRIKSFAEAEKILRFRNIA
ncbi:MAG: tRNA dimethylallyltransferase, partial [Parcubacteria group bacterium GW2011_GWA2_48_9]